MRVIRKLMMPVAAAALCTVGLSAQDVFVKQVEFPAGATTAQKLEMAGRLVPTQGQLDWQNLEFTAFLHFGVNTFTNREWGDGKESEEIFNPEGLDADQWVKVLKDAGVKLVILTAKHHDGFCLWPTETTKHSVANSPWKGGKGDVVAELRKACDKYGMKLGLYLSPWDRNAECYGDSPKYNDMFVAQLTELLSNYGKIDEVWFDGACGEGPNGKKQVYDWNRFKETIHKLQPDAVTAIMGDDVRWVGNEAGLGRETEWSATAITPGILPEADERNNALGLVAKSKDLGGKEIVDKADRLYWWPSEVDVSIRPGWFYHDTELPKSLRQLAEIYLNSVGRNSVLLLNVPPDRNGRIADADVERLMELRTWLDEAFADNLARVDGTFRAPAAVNTVVLQEDISKGQRVEAFDVEAMVDGEWRKVAGGTTIGHKRILRFPETTATAVRVNVSDSRGKANLAPVEAYLIEMPEASNETLPGYKILKGGKWGLFGTPGRVKDAYAAIDGDGTTFWQSPARDGEKRLHLDLGKRMPVAGFVYTPREGDDKSGTVFHYKVEVSPDGQVFHPVNVSGEFSNIVNNPIEQKVYFPNTVNARFIRFTALDEIEGRDFITIGEFGVITPQ